MQMLKLTISIFLLFPAALNCMEKQYQEQQKETKPYKLPAFEEFLTIEKTGYEESPSYYGALKNNSTIRATKHRKGIICHVITPIEIGGFTHFDEDRVNLKSDDFKTLESYYKHLHSPKSKKRP